MSKEKNLIPELRFPEFVNEGEWETSKVKNLFYLLDGYPFSSLDFTSLQKDSNQIIRITDINNQNRNKEKVYISNEKIHELDVEKYKVQQGDLLLSLTGAAGFNFFICDVDNAYINQRTVKIQLKNEQNSALKILLESLISSKINAIGTGQNNNLSKEALKEIEFPFPKPYEQQKIAACLSSLVEVITAHSQKLDLLKEHKKGLMHNLFPQDGEKVPRLRFKEFVNDEEWKEKPLGSLSNLISEKAGTKKYKLLSVTAGIGFVSQLEKFGREIAGDSYKNYYVIRKGDFAYNKSSVKIHPEGQIALLENDDFGAVPNSIFTCFRVDKNILLPAFLKYPFENNIHGKWLRKFIAVGARANGALNVDNKDLLALPIKFPSIAEQQKIASCLSSLDDLIKSQTEKVEQLKLHKKGLMQGLFPKINE